MLQDLTKNHFELFGLPKSYVLDEAQLAQQFRERQSAVHPDRFVNATDAEKRASMQLAALTNEAHETLKSPLRRALYLLRLQQYDPDSNKVQLEPMFLMEQMALRESISEAPGQNDPYAILDEVSARVRIQKKTIVADIQRAFEAEQPDSVSIHRMTQKLQFLDKLMEEIQSVEAKLDDA